MYLKLRTENYWIAASVEALGLKPIFEVLDSLGLPKEPPMQGKIPSIDISRIAGTGQRTLGLNLFINFYISEDVKDTTRNRMMVRMLPHLKYKF